MLDRNIDGDGGDHLTMQEDKVAANTFRYETRPAHGLQGSRACLAFARFLGVQLMCLRGIYSGGAILPYGFNTLTVTCIRFSQGCINRAR